MSMPSWKLNIFVRVVSKSMQDESKTADEVLADYTALTETEKDEIKANL